VSDERLQPGIYVGRGRRPPPHFRLVLLDVASGVGPDAVVDALAETDAMLRVLPEGRVRELQGQPAEHAGASSAQFAGLEHLIGFGRRLFDDRVHGQPQVAVERPDYLSYLPDDGPFPALRWVNGHDGRNRGEADVALQLTGEHPSGVNCAAVEIWKLLADLGGPLHVVATFGGFSRHDGRGWLEFHDGVSNIEPSQREGALVAPSDPEWMAGGTYMAFMRLAIDLPAWRSRSRTDQELIVGRDKLTGGALTATEQDTDGRNRPVAATPPGDDATDRQLSDHIDPPQTTDRLVEASHIHRANQNRASPSAPGAFRIFRQGYDYLDEVEGDRPRLGLNFVSFQRDLAAVDHMLHLPGWLGDANFGGPVAPAPGGARPGPNDRSRRWRVLRRATHRPSVPRRRVLPNQRPAQVPLAEPGPWPTADL
jgi:Dyp-type peroxidase family